MNDLKFSVCITTYNRAEFIGETIKSILAQNFTNYEIIVSDNNSTDNTEWIVKSFGDKRIKYFKNETNVGFTKNLDLCKQRATGDIIYFVAAKSVISKDALSKTYNAFKLSDDIGAVTRPYYWYGKNVRTPVRAKTIYDETEDTVVSINNGEKAIIAVFNTLDNPSGLAYRKDYMDIPFHKDPFVEFTYPFASILKKHKVVLLKDYTMACPAFLYSGSQDPLVYKKSPIKNWVDLFNSVFFEEEFKDIRTRCIKNFVAVNYIGLVQIKNYGTYKALFKEIYYLLKYRWQNIFNVAFWIFSIGTVLIPRFILKKMVMWYKERINSRFLKNVKPLDY